MEWLEQFGDTQIRTRAKEDPVLARVLNDALAGIYHLLEELRRPYRLAAELTRSGEYMIRMRVEYRNKAERDRIWDRAAQILEETRTGHEVNILCGINPLTSKEIPSEVDKVTDVPGRVDAPSNDQGGV